MDEQNSMRMLEKDVNGHAIGMLCKHRTQRQNIHATVTCVGMPDNAQAMVYHAEEGKYTQVAKASLDILQKHFTLLRNKQA
jgi:hypothetical protein